MSKTVEITSPAAFAGLLKSSEIVVADCKWESYLRILCPYSWFAPPFALVVTTLDCPAVHT